MKKTGTLLLTLLLALSMSACTNSANSNNTAAASDSTKEAVQQEVTPQADAKNEDAGIQGISESTSDTAGADETSEATTENTSEVASSEPASETDTGSGKILVAYFSATNTTKGVAEKIADIMGADIYEIVPKDPYTDADLNYHDNKSRTTIEMNDPDVRPEISGSVENMSQYDVVFIGYPIWWSEAPRIIDTFVESYDFSGKTIVAFCTSGGSGIGSSAANLEKHTSGAEWLDGKRFNGGDSSDTIKKWVDGLNIAY